MRQRITDCARDLFTQILAPRRCILCGADSGTGRLVCDRCVETKLLKGASRLSLAFQNEDRCERCGRPLVSAMKTCLCCREKTLFGSIDRIVPLFPYTAAGQELLTVWKVGGMRALSLPLARSLAVFLSSCVSVPIVPVPPRPGKIRERGWDQVEELSLLLEKQFGMTVCRCLERKSILQQKKLGKAERFLNMKSSIAVKQGIALPDSVIVLDDLMTTGATLDACAEALKIAGCGKVYGLTLFFD